MKILADYPDLNAQSHPDIVLVSEDNSIDQNEESPPSIRSENSLSDLELDHIQHQAYCLLKKQGIADGDRQTWFTTIAAIKETLKTEHLPEWLLELNRSDVHNNWRQDTQTLWKSLNRKTGSKINAVTLDYLYRQYQDSEQQRKAEATLASYLARVDDAETESQLQQIIRDIKEDASLKNIQRRRLAAPIQKRFGTKRIGAPTVGDIRNELSDPTETDHAKKSSSSISVVEIVIQDLDQHGTYFTNRQGQPVIELNIDGENTIFSIDHGTLNDWLTATSKQRYGFRLNKKQKGEIVDYVASTARRSTLVYDTPLRYGYQMSKDTNVQELLYEDICDADNTILQISADGIQPWSTDSSCKPRFLRGPRTNPTSPHSPMNRAEMLAHANELLDLLNLPKVMEMAYLGWLINARMPPNRQPPLYVTGPPNSGKSILIEQTEKLTDPKSSRQTTKSKKQRDIRARLASHWLTAENNGKHYSGEIQDDFCVAADGGDAEDATLYQNLGVTNYSIAGPICISSKESDAVDQSDLEERLLPLQLDALVKPIDDTELRMTFDTKLPQYHSMLRYMTVECLRVLPSITETSGHRYSEYARIVNTCSAIMKYDITMADIMADTYRGALIKEFERSIFLQGVVMLMVLLYPEGWRGRGDELLAQLDNVALRSDRAKRLDSDQYPRTSAHVWTHLKNGSEALAQAGVDFQRDGRSNLGNIMHLTLNENAPGQDECRHRVCSYALESFAWMFI